MVPSLPWAMMALCLLATVAITAAVNCGAVAAGASCGSTQCCSKFMFCGTTSAHCGSGCQAVSLSQECVSSTPRATGNDAAPPR